MSRERTIMADCMATEVACMATEDEGTYIVGLDSYSHSKSTGISGLILTLQGYRDIWVDTHTSGVQGYLG